MNNDERFRAVDGMFEAGEPARSLDFLIEDFRAAKDLPALFEAKLMKCRLELGLPLIQTEPASSYPPEARQVYEETVVEAAREVGQGFLAEGRIDRAWPYFRAIGETGPVAGAIEHIEPEKAGEEIESVIAIAFQEGVHPVKGLELILARHGMCRAITAFGMYAVEKDRGQCIHLLVRAIHAELLERLKSAIASVEGAAPETDNIPALIDGRDWLFGEYNAYVDTSHLTSILQYSPDLADPAILQLICELCEYGKRLSENFQFRGRPPFEDVFAGYGHYARALRGLDVDVSIAYFRDKVVQCDPAEAGYAPAETLVRLLVSLGRHREALDVALEHLRGVSPAELNCPSPLHLCRLAGDYDRLMALAEERGDVLSYAAAGLERRRQGPDRTSALTDLIRLVEECEEDTRKFLGAGAANRLGNWRSHTGTQANLVSYISGLLTGPRRANGWELDQKGGLSLERIVLDRFPDLFSGTDLLEAKRTLGLAE